MSEPEMHHDLLKQEILKENLIEEKEPAPVKPKGKKPFFNRTSIVVIFCTCIITSTILGYQSGLQKSQTTTDTGLVQQNGTVSYQSLATNNSSGDLPIEEIAAKTADSVVQISTEAVGQNAFVGQYVTEGAGSGVIVKSDGYIVTNNHVIDKASKITVTLRTGSSYEAKVLGTDETTDIAVLKIDASGLQAAQFGDSDTLKVGEPAVAIGNPLGKLGGTVTDGIISALDREIDLGGETMNLLQTDAAINPGNSGGGLFNGQGQLVGIVVAKSTGSNVEGLGFAIPINDVKSVINDLKAYGYVQGRIDTGMGFVEIDNPETALFYRLQKTGLYIQSVKEGSNAAEAGFQAGDCILTVDGNAIESLAGFNQILNGHSVGDTLQISVFRDNQTIDLKLKLAQYKP